MPLQKECDVMSVSMHLSVCEGRVCLLLCSTMLHPKKAGLVRINSHSRISYNQFFTIIISSQHKLFISENNGC